jgi:diguanylate cyclase (GGDEF)-like protein
MRVPWLYEFVRKWALVRQRLAGEIPDEVGAWLRISRRLAATVDRRPRAAAKAITAQREKRGSGVTEAPAPSATEREKTLRKTRAFPVKHTARRVPLAVLASLWIASVAAAQAPLNSLAAIEKVTNAQARQVPAVDFVATVTYFRAYEHTLFVEDGNAAIFVSAVASPKLEPGDLVRVQGVLRASFRPYVDGRRITVLDHGSVPQPAPATFEEMIGAQKDCMLVQVKATVRSADVLPSVPVPTTALHLLVDGGPVDATVDSADVAAAANLLDAEVEITGVSSGEFDNKMQQTGVLLHIESLAWVKVLKHPGVDPWSLPVTPMDRMISGYDVRELAQRIHVHGTITYYQPGKAVVLQNGAKSAWVATAGYQPMEIGDAADAIGFPDVQNGFLKLTHSEVVDHLVQDPIVPALLTAKELASGGNTAQGHNFDLVSVEGQVLTEVRQSSEDDYLLSANGRLFSAIFEHANVPAGPSLPPLKQVPVGTQIRVTGICMLENANPFNGDVPFTIMMRNSDDVQVIAKPAWLNVQHLTELVIVLLVIIFFIGVRNAYAERKARRKIAGLAYVERRRGKILEGINNSQPLAELLEQITELVSYRLDGAPCWCQVTEGAKLGNRPPVLSALRVAEMPIPGRTGPALGTICAAFDASTHPRALETEVLSMATGLATLAIETSRLYSDLVHRSEFDLLTDIKNRFALEKHLDMLIQVSRQSAKIFGLLYLDLNDFKQVNDVFGHRAGDLYLQEIALRLKRQLRPGDVLARLGGDEFAVLVPHIRSRADAEEISLRLEACFEAPFAAEGFEVNGSASIGIAIYPEDGSTKDDLLSAGDAAMYTSKQARARRGAISARELAPGASR